MGKPPPKAKGAKFSPGGGGGGGRESQGGDPPLAAGVFHEPALPCSPSPGKYLKQKHLRASMLLCGMLTSRSASGRRMMQQQMRDASD